MLDVAIIADTSDSLWVVSRHAGYFGQPVGVCFTECPDMLDVAIIADMSDSMSDDDAKDLKLPLEDLVNQLQLTAGGHHMALLAYSDQVLVKTDLTGDPTPIQASVQNLKPQGGPADPALALKDMVALMEGPQGRPGVHKTCILITDETSPDPAETARQAAIARSKGIELRVLSVSKDQNDPVDKEARQLVGDKEHVLHADTYGQLAGVMDLASMLLLSSCPGGLVVPVSLVPVGFLTIPGVLPTGNKHAGCQHTISPKPLSTVTPSLSPPTPSTPASTPLPTTVTTTQASSKVTATTAPLATSSIRSTSHTAPVTVTKYGTHTPGTRMTVTPTLTPPATPTPSPTRLTEAVTTPTQPAKTTPPFGLNNTVVPSGACDDCLMVNGVGYKAHWARCDAFLQCQVLADHTVMGTVHYCPHGLHWNRAALTCTRPLQAACSMDRCLHSTQRMFPAVNNCRGYWVCQSGRSEGKCCPPGYSFGGRIGCIPDTACQDSCGVTTSVPRACDKRVVPRMPLTFEQYIPGAGWQLMFCAPGTAYNHSTCGCTDFRANSAIPNTCQAELYLPFKGGVVKDESGNNFVLNEGVKVINGAGYFNGRAVLRVPRFANTDYGDYVLIRLRYKQDGGGGGGGPQALVANGDCLKPSSLYMVAGQKSTSFGSVTTTGHAAVVNVPNSGGGGWKEAVMYVDRQTLTGSVDNFSMQTLFTGSLAGGHCALQFGSGTSFSHFKGFMDDITVYLCRPDTL
ncbi:hypothetical protein ACOMHN_015166 [Nucella lapillus]